MKMKSFFSLTMFLLPVAVFLITWVACSNMGQASFKLTTSVPVTNKNISSGSGAIFGNDSLAVVGDDEPYLFHVNPNDFTTEKKILIKKFPLNEYGRINKSIKPDYEAMGKVNYQGKTYFLILGSGSKSTRNSAYLIDIDGEKKKIFDLAALYKQFNDISGFSSTEHINIEGVANTDTNIFIFNRGNSGTNIIFEMDLNQFFDFISKESDSLASLQSYFVTLPKIAGFESTLSGVDYWPETRSLIFSASVEGKSDAINDGDVLGSFIGVLPISKFKKNTSKSNPQSLSSSMQLINEKDQAVITKVEAVAIEKSDNNSASGVLVSDNDDGTSQFLYFTIEN